MSHDNPPGLPECFLVSMTGSILVAATHISMIWLQAQSSPHDMARGEPLWMMLLNPFVITVAAPIVFLSALLALPVVYFVLRDTVVWMSVTTLYVSVMAEVVFVGLSDQQLAWYLSYPTLLAAAAFSKLAFKRGTSRSV